MVAHLEDPDGAKRNIMHEAGAGICNALKRAYSEVMYGGQGIETYRQNLVGDPHHPAGRRTIEWLIRETSGGRQLRTCTMVATLVMFVLAQWIALLAVTKATLSDSFLPAIVFVAGCGLKIARRMPGYLDHRMFGFLRRTGCLGRRVEDNMDTCVMTDREILNEELDKMPALATGEIRWPGVMAWFLLNYDWYGFLCAMIGIFCSIHPLTIIYTDETGNTENTVPGEEGDAAHVHYAALFITLLCIGPMMVWLIVRYFVSKSRRKMTLILFTIHSNLGRTFSFTLVVVFIVYVILYGAIHDYNRLNYYDTDTMCAQK